MTSTVPEPRPGPGGAGQLLALLRDGVPRTRSELAGMTGLSRSTVAQRVDALLACRLIGPAGDAVSTGGRPPTQFAFDPSSGLVLAADLGATYARLGVTDLAGRVLVERQDDLEIGDGPDRVLSWVVDRGRELLAPLESPGRRLVGVGIGLPGPVEHATGRPIDPPIMPGWDGYDVVERLRRDLGVVVAVDNDVNVMALGERFIAWPGVDHLVFVKVGTGIGAGIISDGELRRGAQGAAGDLGHMQVPRAADVLCRCGNSGCLEAVAGGAALVRELSARGLPVRTSRDVADLARHGDLAVVRELREAGRAIGEVLAHVVSMLNPSVVVVGGSLASTGEHLLAGVREVVYRRSLPLATQHLRIVASGTGEHAGVVGAAVMVIERVLSPDEVDRTLG
ncbi:ROK family transcriptional regulator [Aquipuribacter hungaricus]|uniref:ROK family protein n=1 Tax=Aquipuribacter hungaricus TaxID=545624 RepID=A0ABV7WHL1_9MICO